MADTVAEDTSFLGKPAGTQVTATASTVTGASESSIFGCSLRGVIAFIIVYTVCLMCIWKVPIEQTMHDLVLMVVTFYFAQKTKS